MYAVLYFKKPSDTGIIFPVTASEAFGVKNLLGARMMRGSINQGSDVKWYEIHNVDIISEIDPSFHPEMFERYGSFEEFVKTTRKGVRLTHQL